MLLIFVSPAIIFHLSQVYSVRLSARFFSIADKNHIVNEFSGCELSHFLLLKVYC